VSGAQRSGFLAPVLMIQGTASSVGKSALVAGLCRCFSQRGVRVAPFKAMNLSNNAAVTPDGKEIGRSQATQALACGLEPTVDMNPVLVKPEGSGCWQLVLRGRLWKSRCAELDTGIREVLWEAITSSLERLQQQFELVVAEGSGSPAELNLKGRDLGNMAVAKHSDAAVLLVGNIEFGGIFAQMLGTLELLDPEERRLVKGLVVNRFRGDVSAFDDGRRLLEQRTGVPVLGVVPYRPELELPAEDAADLRRGSLEAGDGLLRIAVIQNPLIANHDEFEALGREPGVRLEYLRQPVPGSIFDAVILPGSKATVHDLMALRRSGLADWILQQMQEGSEVVGICAGYQMLGELIVDREGVESPPGTEAAGLGLLPVRTVFEATKVTRRCHATVVPQTGWTQVAAGLCVEGYQIHCGRVFSESHPFLRLKPSFPGDLPKLEGAMGATGAVWGTSVHGLFENPGFRWLWLGALRQRKLQRLSYTGGVVEPRRGGDQPTGDRAGDKLRGRLGVRTMLNHGENARDGAGHAARGRHGNVPGLGANSGSRPDSPVEAELLRRIDRWASLLEVYVDLPRIARCTGLRVASPS
jgi:adenosylcobyric acid synthase